MVQVVLRDSRSTSPDCSAVKRSLAVSGTNLTLSRVAEDRRRDAAAEVDVEAASSCPCRRARRSPASPVLTPQLQHAAGFDGVERLGSERA